MISFEAGHKVVHKTHGVGVIQGTEVLSLGGQKQDYYILKILSTGLKVRFPKQSFTTIVRNLVTSDEIEEVFEVLRSPAKSYSMVWNRRKKEFTEKIKSGSISEIAEVYRDLHNRDDGKELSFGEKEMLDQARARIISEIAAARSQSGDEVGDYIDQLFQVPQLTRMVH